MTIIADSSIYLSLVGCQCDSSAANPVDQSAWKAQCTITRSFKFKTSFRV
jgi:hypothetical protein